MFSGLYRLAYGDVSMLLITYGARVVGVSDRIFGREDTYSRLKIDKNSAWNIVLVVCLVEEDVLSISRVCCPLLEDAFLVYSVFSA